MYLSLAVSLASHAGKKIGYWHVYAQSAEIYQQVSVPALM